MKKVFLMLFSVLALSALRGQGTLTGTVLDEQIGETLISAYVYVEGADIVTATDFDGKYVLDLDAGTYSLRVTYIGFQDKVITDIVIADGETTYLDITMSSESLEIEEVTVTASAIERTENAMLMLQRRSDKIQDGISSQEMSRLASGNVANAMTKVTGASVQDGKYVYVRGLGDRYSLTQMNGLPMPSIDPYRNSAQLDMIPVNLLDNIITSKTFTPDQPGMFTGGNVNIKTKSFPERQTFSAKVGIRYNTQNNFQDDFLTHNGGSSDWLGYGKNYRARPAILSDTLFAKYSDRNAELQARFGNEEAASTIQNSVDAMDMRFDTVVSSSPIDYAVSLSYGNSWEVGNGGQLGFIASGTFAQQYSHRPNTVQATWFVFDDESGELMNSGNYDKTYSEQNPTVSGFAGLAYKFNPFHSVDFKVLYNNNSSKTTTFIIGEDGQNIEYPSFKLGRALQWEQREMLNYQLSGSHYLASLGNLEINWRANIVDARLDEPNSRFFSSQYDIETGMHGIPLANVNDPYFFWRELKDDIWNAAIDFTKPFDAFGTSGNKIKIGGMYSSRDRDFNEFRNIVVASPWTEPLSAFNGNVNEYLGPGNSGVVDTTVTGSKSRYWVANYINEATQLKNSYTGYERIWAVYGMVTLAPFDDLRFVLGGRYEATDIFVQSKIVELDEIEPDSSNTGSIDLGEFLPSVNVIYSLNENMNLRAGYNHTLARPNLREIAPFASFDPLIDQFFIGNPDLTNTSIKNMDLRWEWFLNPGEMVAVSAFYKIFDNPITLQYLNGSNPEFQFTNVNRGEIRGIEFELRKSLDFISQSMKNFRLITNFAIIDSKTDVILQSGLEPEDRPFEGQAPFIANVQLNYASPENIWDISLTYNYLGDRLAIIGREAPDLYDRKVNTLDFVVNHRFGPSNRMNFKFNVTNILNPLITRSQKYPDLEGNDVEYINTQFRRGVGFGMSLEYKI